MAFFEFDNSQSSAIAAIDTTAGQRNTELSVRYASNPTKEYMFTCDDDTREQIQMIAEAITRNGDSKVSIGKTIHQMIRDEELTPFVD